MAQAAGQEWIFMQTHPLFDLALNALIELNNASRVKNQHVQTVQLERIESNNERDENKFGGGPIVSPVAAFRRTASSVIRMCMLEATQINVKFWPFLGPRTQLRNMRKPQDGFPECFS